MLIDTNVIVSALIFPDSVPAQALRLAVAQEHIVLTQQILGELRTVVARNWPENLLALQRFLAVLPFTLLHPGSPSVPLRDSADQPILDAAVAGGVDVLVTGDRDFLALVIRTPRILTPRQYLDERDPPTPVPSSSSGERPPIPFALRRRAERPPP